MIVIDLLVIAKMPNMVEDLINTTAFLAIIKVLKKSCAIILELRKSDFG